MLAIGVDSKVAHRRFIKETQVRQPGDIDYQTIPVIIYEQATNPSTFTTQVILDYSNSGKDLNFATGHPRCWGIKHSDDLVASSFIPPRNYMIAK